MQYIELKSKVHQHLKADAVKSLVEHVERANPAFWGAESAQRGFVRKTCYISLYRDLYGLSESGLHSQIKSWHIGSSKTLGHNNKVFRRCAAVWAKKKVRRGKKEEWDAAAHNVTRPKPFDSVNLWIDSADFQIQKDRVYDAHLRTMSEFWSGKIHKFAVRFMVIMDAKYRIREVSEGYGSKAYDGSYLSIRKHEFEKNFRGGVFVGDEHFWNGTKIFGSEVKFHVNKPNQGRKRKRDEMEMTEEEEIREAIVSNRQTILAQVRSRVEAPFGNIKRRWTSLAKPWKESVNQQSYLMLIACAFHNADHP